MSNLSWHAFSFNPVLVGAALILSSSALAGEIPPQTSSSVTPLPPTENVPAASTPTTSDPIETYRQAVEQITSISQFRDVSPQSWSYEALKNLVERYGCIVGYPDRTYRGERALTRDEFAAGLSACLQQLEARMLEAMKATQSSQTTTPSSEPQVTTDFTLNEAFSRAFYNDTGRFYEQTGISGQLNKIFGWRSFPGSFNDNQIANDGLTVETIYYDALRQQNSGPRMMSRDLPNPFDSSLTTNPDYLGNPPPANPSFSAPSPESPFFR
jgi:hypothetical protein